MRVPVTILLSLLVCVALPLHARAAPAARPNAPRAASASDDEAMGRLLEQDLERRWGKTRAIQVVVDRLYPKAHHFELDVFCGVLPNDPFLIYVTPGLRLAWHFNEQWALELGGSYSAGLDTPLRQQLEQDDALLQVRLRDKVLARFGLAVLWSPVYGKMAFSNRKIGHFDLYFLAEASGLYAEAVDALDLKGGVWGGVGLGLGFRFFFTTLLSLRVEFRQRVEIREGLGDAAIRVGYPSELSLGLSFLFGRSRRAP